MKIKTLAWLQIVIGLVILLKAIGLITNGTNSVSYQIGAYADMILISLFALLTGLYNLKQKK